jgi:hypothetical protein
LIRARVVSATVVLVLVLVLALVLLLMPVLALVLLLMPVLALVLARALVLMPVVVLGLVLARALVLLLWPLLLLLRTPPPVATRLLAGHLPTSPLVVLGVSDEPEHEVRVGATAGVLVLTGQARRRRELPALVESPHLLGIGERATPGDKAPGEVMQILDIAQQELACVLVARRVHRLREVDDHGAVLRHEHIEVRKICMHDAGAEHAHDLLQEPLEDVRRLVA